MWRLFKAKSIFKDLIDAFITKAKVQGYLKLL